MLWYVIQYLSQMLYKPTKHTKPTNCICELAPGSTSTTWILIGDKKKLIGQQHSHTWLWLYIQNSILWYHSHLKPVQVRELKYITTKGRQAARLWGCMQKDSNVTFRSNFLRHRGLATHYWCTPNFKAAVGRKLLHKWAEFWINRGFGSTLEERFQRLCKSNHGDCIWNQGSA